ncbi:hypothetical protein FG386_000994 [Cryptosporidium ryanae]|uniref:uncharacterized protein n=1 Tax=Cryptosporidium ryanae TaxID=515981 RepID=UPI00351A9DC6|nr:hypothetical protein FG386_000994 [Cryptosporidium ryanae]
MDKMKRVFKKWRNKAEEAVKSEDKLNSTGKSLETCKNENNNNVSNSEVERNIYKLNFEVPKILDCFPDIYTSKTINNTSYVGGNVGHLICGTISSYFEDTWKRNISDYRRNVLNICDNGGKSMEYIMESRTGSYYGFGVSSRTGSFSGFGVLSRTGSFSGLKESSKNEGKNPEGSDLGSELGIYLKREWHRLWLVRSFLAFCWENYLEDLLELNSLKRKHYLSLPCYGTSLIGLRKIPLGEIICIVISSSLIFTMSDKKFQVPFSTVQGKIINKITLRVDKKRHWKTPPPNSVAKFRIHAENKSEPTDIYISLDVDKPVLLWRKNLPEHIPADFNNLYVISSCVRVLRKGEIGKFVINRNFNVNVELVLELLDWYHELCVNLVYDNNKKAECKYFVLSGANETIFKEDLDNDNVEYCITANERKEKAVFSTKNGIITKKDVNSNLINTVLEKNNKVVVYLTSELLTAELSTLKKSFETNKLVTAFGNALTGILAGNKRYFFHLERKHKKQQLFRDNASIKPNMLLLNHITNSRKHFECRIKLLDDLRKFGELVLSKIEIKKGQTMIIEDVLFKELSGNNNGLIENLKINFGELFSKNLFRIPFILLEHQNEYEDDKGNDITQNLIYFISPCIKTESELLYYTLFERLVSYSREDSKAFSIVPIDESGLMLNNTLGINTESEIMGMSHYIKGISMIREIGGFDFDMPQNKVEELNDNHKWLKFLNEEIQEISNRIDGGNGFFNYLIRTSFYLLLSNYSDKNIKDIKNESDNLVDGDIYTSDNEEVKMEFSDHFDYLELQKCIRSETGKKSSAYYRSIGIMAEILLDIHVNIKVNLDSIAELILIIWEKMRHASGFDIVLNYTFTWILIQMYNHKICEVNLLKSDICDVFTIHRICREFMRSHKSEIFKNTLEKISTRYFESCVLKTDLPINNILVAEIGCEKTKPFESNREPSECFFKLIIDYDVLERLSLLLLGPASKRILEDGKNEYYNLLKYSPDYGFFSIGSNSSGALGIGMPKYNLFTSLECKLCSNLEKINSIYRQKGQECEYISKNIQRVVFKDNFSFESGISSVQYGKDHILVLRKNGTLFSWGSNKYGQCCQEKVKRAKSLLSKLSSADEVKENKRCGSDYEEVLFEKRIQEYDNIIPLPEEILFFSKVVNKVSISKISCGSNFSLALDTKGNLYSWGQGKDGCLGTGSLEDSFVPKRIELGFEHKIRSITSGMFHCGAIDIESQLYVWGSNEFGQLGIQYSKNSEKVISSPFKLNVGFINFNESYSSSLDAKVIIKNCEEDLKACLLEECGDGSASSEGIIIEWKELSFGEVHSIALDTNGCVWVWGQNNFKQLTKIPEILSLEFILEGWERKMTLMKRSESNIETEKANGTFTNFPTPLISKKKQKVFDSKKIDKIFSGSTCCCAIDQEGKPWIWGLTFSGIEGQSSRYYASSFFERNSSMSGKPKKQEKLIEFKEIELPVRIFRNMTNDNDSIRLIKFGKGNNNLSMVSRYGRCYLWLENQNLVVNQMKFSSQHNCYVLSDNLETANEKKGSNIGTRILPDGPFSDNVRCIQDVALLGDSIIFLSKQKSINMP